MTWLIVHLVLTVVFLGLAAVFTAIGAALAALTPGRVRKLVDDEVKQASALADIVADPGPTVATAGFLALLGEVGLVVTVASWLWSPGRAWWWLLIGGAIGLVGLFVVVSVGARTLGRQHGVGLGLASTGLMRALTAVIGFIPGLLILVGNAITPGRGYLDGPFTSEDELLEYVDRAEAAQQIEADEKKMIHSVFDLGDTLVREVMVPRPDVVYIDATKTLRQAQSLALRSGFSRIPVVGPGGLDDISGIVYLKDVVKRVYDKPDAQSSELVASLARPVSWCPDSKPADDLLRQMQADHSHLAVVVDEFGGTAGVITIEDLLEEIVGEIRDEYDTEPEAVTELAPGRYRVSARLSLADLGDLFGLALADEEVDSVGGILAKLLNQVPLPGASARWRGLELTADAVSGRRHRLAFVTVARESPDTAGGADHD